jgi:transcriptional regulator with XRE-family HTH domain
VTLRQGRDIEMSDLGNRLKEVRGRLSRDRFAEIMGVARNSIQRYEAGETTPDADFIKSVCTAFGIKSHWLLFGSGEKSENQNDTGDFCYVPMVEPVLSAGDGNFIESEEVEGYYSFRKDFINRINSDIKKLFLVRVSGDSMLPTIKENDVVMIDTGKKHIIDGRLYAINIADTLIVKRVIKQSGQEAIIYSDNVEIYKSFTEHLSNIKVVGQLVWMCRQISAF